MKRSNRNVTGVPEREERLTVKNFPKLMTETNSGSITKNYLK